MKTKYFNKEKYLAKYGEDKVHPIYLKIPEDVGMTVIPYDKEIYNYKVEDTTVFLEPDIMDDKPLSERRKINEI